MKKELKLIEQAKEMFSIGDRFHPVNTSSGTVMEDSHPYIIERDLDRSIYYPEEDVLCNGGNIYAKGTWAKK